MTIVTLIGTSLVFVLFGWNDPSARAAVLTVGTVVCVAASMAGDISQDLKTGWLLRATPASQQFGQLLGIAVTCWAVAGTVMLLGSAYTFGSEQLPAPQATLMKTVIDGVLSGQLPWGLVGAGGALSLCAMLAGVAGLPFAVGLYLPLGTLTPIFVGGVVRRVVDARRGPAEKSDGDQGVLAASGMIAGEGLVGVGIAAVVAALNTWPQAAWTARLERWHFADSHFSYLTGGWAAGAGVLLVLGVCAVLYRAGHNRVASD